MAVKLNPSFNQSEVWPEEREGYHSHGPAAYPVVEVAPSPRSFIPVWLEERFACLLAGGAIVWSFRVFTSPMLRVSKLTDNPGPLELCAISFLIWLHAKWRRSVGR
jgi:hypothetical protein